MLIRDSRSRIDEGESQCHDREDIPMSLEDLQLGGENPKIQTLEQLNR